jgi:hypothetical protein
MKPCRAPVVEVLELIRQPLPKWETRFPNPRSYGLLTYWEISISSQY